MSRATTKVPENVLDVLRRCTTSGCILYLPEETLDRELYVAVNKVLNKMGSHWNRAAKGHVFDHDPAGDLYAVLETGTVTDEKKAFQLYETPPELAQRMCELADIQGISFVLEPSCGKGAILDEIVNCNPLVVCGIELNPNMEVFYAGKPYKDKVFFGKDFLTCAGEQWENTYDRIVMNPPFSNLQDVDHIRHAFELLTPGGILVAVCSESPFYRSDNKSQGFRSFLAMHNAEVEDLPAGTFKESGTMVGAKLIKLVKPEKV